MTMHEDERKGDNNGFDLVNGKGEGGTWQGEMSFNLMVSKYLMQSGARHSRPAGELMDVL